MKLQVHTIKPARGSKHSHKKLGRGNASGHGTTAGRGGKGQTARSGGRRGLRLKGFKRLMQSTPKLRGFKSLKIKPAEVYLSDLDKNFEDNATVDLAALKEKGIIGINDAVAKILNKGELTKKLSVVGIKATKIAKELVEKAGGSVSA